MSSWVRGRKTGGVAAAVFKVLAMCRAKARAMGLSRSHAIAGNVAKGQVWAKRAERGLSGKGRLEEAKRLQAQRAAGKAKPSLREQAAAHRAGKGDIPGRAKSLEARLEERRQKRLESPVTIESRSALSNTGMHQSGGKGSGKARWWLKGESGFADIPSTRGDFKLKTKIPYKPGTYTLGTGIGRHAIRQEIVITPRLEQTPVEAARKARIARIVEQATRAPAKPSLREQVAPKPSPSAERLKRLGAPTPEHAALLAKARAGRAVELRAQRKTVATAAKPAAPAAAGPASKEHDVHAIHAAFHVSPGRKDNFVSLADLREKTGLSRERFDAAFRELQKRRVLSGEVHEGLFTKTGFDIKRHTAGGIPQKGEGTKPLTWAQLTNPESAPPKPMAAAVPKPKPTPKPKPPKPAPAPKPPTKPFHEQVTAAAAKVPTAKRFGENKAFIHHVHEEHQRQPENPRMSLDTFKRQLAEDTAVRAHLSRADLVQAMHPADVAKSHTPVHIGGHEAASFNFVRTPGTSTGVAHVAPKAKAAPSKATGRGTAERAGKAAKLATLRKQLHSVKADLQHHNEAWAKRTAHTGDQSRQDRLDEQQSVQRAIERLRGKKRKVG